MKTKILPESFLNKIDKQERKKMGPSGRTFLEACAVNDAKSEREIQRQIAQWLRLKGVWFAQSRMDKRTTNGVGQPDFLLCWTECINGNEYRRPTAIEVKHGSGKLSPEQESVRGKMLHDGWQFHIVRSLKEVMEIVRL